MMIQASEQPIGKNTAKNTGKNIDKSLWVLTCQSDIQSDIGVWLGETQWQSTTDLKDIRHCLLNHTQGSVLLDMRNSPHKILSDIRYIKEHFSNCTMIALVDPDHRQWGQEALRHGVDVYISMEDLSSRGMAMLIESLKSKRNQQTLQGASSDQSTGLINGPLFFDRLSHALQVAVRHQCRTGILLVSLDDYSVLSEEVDDVLFGGILSQVAARLSTTIRDSDSLARIEDGLFAILLEDLNDEVMVAHIAQKVRQQFEKSFNVHNQYYSLTASIGGHLCEAEELNGGALYQQTQEALERAISSGRQGLWFYIQEMNFKAMARLNMLQGLERGLEKNEFQLQYLPSHTGKGFIPSGVTPVMIWKHPTAGIVTSEIFMSLLIDSGLIIDAGEWIIKTVCRQLNDWSQTGNWNSRLQLFLPVSEKQIRNTDLTGILIREMAVNNINSEQVILKISEQTAVKNSVIINKLAVNIPNIGLAIELNGASSGYNSFSYLKTMPVDCVCLDKHFFQHIHIDHLDTSIATVIVNVAHSLGIEVMASGADSEYKIKKMQALGCNSLQGEYFSVPIYAESWANYLVNQ
jgi:diguanylate cyclase (GGDEF)-like protein